MRCITALAGVSCFRSLAGFGFPLFAPAMYNALGYGKADTILAGLALGIGCPAYVLSVYFGRCTNVTNTALGSSGTSENAFGD